MNLTMTRNDWFLNIEERAHPWPSLNWLTTQLVVSDVSKAIILYEKIFGFIPIFQFSDENQNLIFARMRYRGSNFTLNAENRFDFKGKAPADTKAIPPFTFYLYVDDTEATYSLALENGCTSLQAPYEEVWGDRKARISDPFGYHWDIATKSL